MKKLNLNKIKLYCILNNVKDWRGVPSCWNCQYQHKEPCLQKMAVYFYYGEDIKNFQLDNSLHSDKDVYRQEEYEKFFQKNGDRYFGTFIIGRKVYYIDCGCDEWRKRT